MSRILSGFIAAAAAAVSLACAAHAADIPARLPAKVMPSEVPAYNWAGIYTATLIGGGWQHVRGHSPAGLVDNTDGSRFWTGSVVGVQGMWGNWVLGVEGSYAAPFSRKYDSSSAGPDCTIGPGLACNSRIRNVWTAGGKVGYALGNWMVYGAGGYAIGRIDETTTLGGIVVSEGRAHHNGWYAGAGIDWYVTRIWWSDLILGVEYRHIALDNGTHNDVAGPAFNKTFNADADLIMAKATLKWVGMGPLNAFK